MGELIAALVVLMMPGTDRCAALEALDAVRAEAWAMTDERLLADVYDAGAGERDARGLRAWRDRGVRIEGMRMVRSGCRPVGASGVEVVERLGPAVAVLPDGSRRALPRDGWDRRIIGLEWVRGRWRIVAVS